MVSLREYLTSLNCADSSQGIWVNPDNVDDYIIRPIMFGYNAQDYGNRVCIGSLDKLSYGYQSTYDAIKAYLEDHKYAHNLSTFEYNGRVRVSISGILSAYSDNLLDEDMVKFLEREAETIEKIWSEVEADLFINEELPIIIEASRGN